MEVLIIIALVLVNGFFALSEISVVSSRKSRLEAAADKGHPGAIRAVQLRENPSRFLSTVQVGITLIGILTGLFGGASLAGRLQTPISKIDALAPYRHAIAVTLSVVIITYFSIVVGELVPKRIGLTLPEKMATVISRPMLVLSRMAAPFIWLLSKSTEALVRLFRIQKTEEQAVTEEEIRAIVHEGAEAGSIREIEQDLVENVFVLGDRTVGSLMTHRNEVVWIDASLPFQPQFDQLINKPFSVFPVCEGDIDKITGIFHLRDYARAMMKKQGFELAEWIRKPLFFPENMRAYAALELLRHSRVHFGVITDEYGSVQGIVTLNDLLDQMVGDIIVDDEDKDIVEREDGSLLVNASVNINELWQRLNIPAEPVPYNTVAGLVLHYAHQIPVTGFSFQWKGFKVEVADMDGHKIDKVLVAKDEG